MDSTMNLTDSFEERMAHNSAFLGKTVHDFALLILRQAENVYGRYGISFPVSVSSTVLYLSEARSASLLDIARVLDHPHQLIAQRIKILLKHDLVVGKKDPDDQRRTLYKLTVEGKKQAESLKTYCRDAAVVFDMLSEEVGGDLQAKIQQASNALKARSMAARLDALSINKGAK